MTATNRYSSCYVLFPIKYHDIWDFYKHAVASFWTVDELANGDEDLMEITKLPDASSSIQFKTTNTPASVLSVSGRVSSATKKMSTSGNSSLGSMPVSSTATIPSSSQSSTTPSQQYHPPSTAKHSTKTSSHLRSAFISTTPPTSGPTSAVNSAPTIGPPPHHHVPPHTSSSTKTSTSTPHAHSSSAQLSMTPAVADLSPDDTDTLL